MVEVSENSTSGSCNERLETAGTSKLEPLIPQQTDTDRDMKELYMNSSGGRRKSLSQHDLSSTQQWQGDKEREKSAILAVPGSSGSYTIHTSLSSDVLGTIRNARFDDIMVAMDSNSPMRPSGLTLRSAGLPKMGQISHRKLATTRPGLVSLLFII